MKKIMLICCFILGIAAVSRAQGGGQRMSPADRAKAMQTQLKLSDDQTAKITAILQTQQTKMDSVRTAANGDRDAMRAGMTPIRTASMNQINNVLTPEQAAAYKKWMDDQRAARQNGGGGGGK